MRRLVHIFLFVTLLGFALSGCRQSAAERRLVAADTLIAHGDYDSALAQLRAIDTTSLSHDELAYHGLLMAHAAYKAYDNAYLDTTWIARARTAYANGGPYDRHIRTLLYSGCVAEELGDPLTAMRWYKRTELETRADDHYHRGYALMKMGIIYQDHINEVEAIEKYQQSLPHLKAVSDTNYLLYTHLQLCQLHLLDNIDSARHYAAITHRLATEAHNDYYHYLVTTVSAKSLFYSDKYELAKDSLLFVLNHMEQTPAVLWYMLGVCYAQMGKTDSARYYYDHAPQPVDQNDSISQHHLLSLIYKSQNKLVESEKELEISNDMSDNAILESTDNKYLQLEQKLTATHEKARIKRVFTYIGLGIGLLLLVMLVINRLVFRLHERRKNEVIEQLQTYINQLQDTNKQFAENIDNLLQQAARQQPINHDNIAELTETYRIILTQIRKKMGKDSKSLNVAILGAMTPSYFSHLHQYVDLAHNGLATTLSQSGKLSEKEINVVCMRACRVPNSIISIYTRHASPQGAIRYQNQIATKYFGEPSSIDRFLSL